MYSSFYVMVPFTLIYVLYLIDKAWITGSRAWKHFRELQLWRRLTPVKYYFANTGDSVNDDVQVFGLENTKRKKFLFIVMPNATNAPLIWGFGLHGARFAPSIKLRFLVPAVLFYVPIIRDFLMWIGGVAYYPGKQWTTINDLLNSGHSVAYSCNGMQDAFSAHDREGKEIHVKTPDDQLFEFARKEGIALVPVIVGGENERYVFTPKPPAFMVTLQEFFYSNWGVVWPLLCMPTRQSKLHMQFCPTIQPHIYDTTEEFKLEFLRCIRSANNNGADKRIIFE